MSALLIHSSRQTPKTPDNRLVGDYLRKHFRYFQPSKNAEGAAKPQRLSYFPLSRRLLRQAHGIQNRDIFHNTWPNNLCCLFLQDSRDLVVVQLQG